MSVISRLKIGHRLTLLVLAFVLALAATFMVMLKMTSDQMYADRVASLRNMVEMGVGQAQMIRKREEAGEITREQALGLFRESLNNLWYDNHKNYVFSYDMQGINVALPADPSFVGQNKINVVDVNGVPIVRGYIELARNPDGGTLTYYWMRPGETAAVPKLAYVRPFAPWNLFVVTGVYIDDIDEAYTRFLLSAGGVGLGLVLLAGLAAWLIARGIINPLSRLRGVMTTMTQGKIDITVPDTDRQDELGEMARAIDVFKANAAEVQHLRIDQERDREQAALDRKKAMHDLADRFEGTVMGVIRSVLDASKGLQTTAQTLSTAAAQSMSQASSVAAASEQATSNVQTVAAATEELSAAIGEISRQVDDSAKISASASESANQTTKMVQELSASADRIGEVVQLITDVASQTNLLALNATIEAARAGDAGKGFAVVAGEVKNLANQTARATDEISRQIASVQEETRKTVEAISTIDGVIDQVRQISANIATAVEEQGAATREIARNVQEAAQGTQEVSASIAGVSESASRTGAAAKDVLESAGDLARYSESLRNEVTGFLEEVRSA